MAYKTVIDRGDVDIEIKGLYTEITHIITERHIQFNIEELPIGTKVSLVRRGELVTGKVTSINSDRITISIESVRTSLDIDVHSAFCAELAKNKEG